MAEVGKPLGHAGIDKLKICKVRTQTELETDESGNLQNEGKLPQNSDVFDV
jgi:hypothetical protein